MAHMGEWTLQEILTTLSDKTKYSSLSESDISSISEFLNNNLKRDFTTLNFEELEQLSSLLDNFIQDSNLKDAYTSKIREQQALLARQNPGNSAAIETLMSNVEDLTPSQLGDLHRNLTSKPESAQTDEKTAELENIIARKSQNIADDKTTILDMEENYALSELLGDVQTQHDDKMPDEDVDTITRALNRVEREINGFEEQYGISPELLQEPALVEYNISQLDSLPSDEELFALNLHNEYLQPATSYQDVIQLLNSAYENNSLPEISALAGAVQANDLNETQKKQLSDLIQQRISSTQKLSQKDFANFDLLLETAATLPNANKNLLKAKKALLNSARKEYRKSASLRNPEFQDIFNITRALSIKGKFKTFGRETINQKTKNSDISLFMEQTRRETEMYLANTSPNGITPEEFKKEYANRLRYHLVQAVYADKMSKGRLEAKDYDKMFEQLALAAQTNKTIKLNRSSLIGYQAAAINRISNAANRMETKPEYQAAAKSYKERIQTLDKKLTQKYGVVYSSLKNVAKSASWGAAYSIAGTTFGPAGIACVATASFANSAWGMFKDFKNKQDLAREHNEKLSFWSYLKQNKSRAIGVALSATAALCGGLEATQILQDPKIIGVVNSARSSSGLLLAGASMLKQSAMAYEQTQGSKAKKTWAYFKAMGISAASFAAGMYAGKTVSEFAGENFGASSVDNNQEPITNLSNAERPPHTGVPLRDLPDYEFDPKNPLGLDWLNQHDQQDTLSPVSQPVSPANGNEEVIVEHREPISDNKLQEAPIAPNGNEEVIVEHKEPILDNKLQEAPIIPEANPEASAEPVENPENQQEANQEKTDISKIKVKGDTNKIVGNIDGERAVSYDNLENKTDYDINKIKYHENGDVTIKMTADDGTKIKFTLDENGEVQRLRSGTHTYTKEELDYINNSEPFKEHMQDQYNKTLEMKENAAESLREAQTAETPAQEAPEAAREEAAAVETPAQEAPEAAREEAAAVKTPAQEAPEAAREEAAAVETPAQEAPEAAREEAAAVETPAQEDMSFRSPKDIAQSDEINEYYIIDEKGTLTYENMDTFPELKEAVSHQTNMLFGDVGDQELPIKTKLQMSSEKLEISKIVYEDIVYNNLQASLDKGIELPENTHVFMKQHEESLESLGYTRDDKGFLQCPDADKPVHKYLNAENTPQSPQKMLMDRIQQLQNRQR